MVLVPVLRQQQHFELDGVGGRLFDTHANSVAVVQDEYMMVWITLCRSAGDNSDWILDICLG